MKFAHISDCHLSESLDVDYTISDKIREEIWKSFEDILCDIKDTDFLLISGDLFEKNYFTKKNYDRLFSDIKRYGKDVYYVNGNHDPLDDMTKFFFKEKPSNLHLFPTDIIDFYEFKDTRIYGISYDDRIFNKRFNYNVSLNHDYNNILLVHADVLSDDSNYFNIDINRLRNMGFDYVAMGHIHKMMDFKDNIYYAGSIEPRSFKDIGKYGYILVDDFKIDYINSQKIEFKELNLEVNENTDIYEEIESQIEDRMNYLRIHFYVDRSVEFEFDKKNLLSNNNIQYINYDINYKKDYEYEDLTRLYPNTILSEFINELENVSDSDIKKLALEYGVDAIFRSADE